MNITGVQILFDGGTLEITMDNNDVYCIDRRYDSQTYDRLFLGNPRDGNIIKNTQLGFDIYWLLTEYESSNEYCLKQLSLMGDEYDTHIAYVLNNTLKFKRE